MRVKINIGRFGGLRPAGPKITNDGKLEARSMDDLSKEAIYIDLDSMVRLNETTERSHALFLTVARIGQHRQPVVIKQYADTGHAPAYYAMAFIPGTAKNSLVYDGEERIGAISPELKRKRLNITHEFNYRYLSPPDEFMYTADGNVFPIDPGGLHFTNGRELSDKEPAQAFVLSQMGGPEFYAVVMDKTLREQVLGILASNDFVTIHDLAVRLKVAEDQIEEILDRENIKPIKFTLPKTYRKIIPHSLREKEESASSTVIGNVDVMDPALYERVRHVLATSIERIMTSDQLAIMLGTTPGMIDQCP